MAGISTAEITAEIGNWFTTNADRIPAMFDNAAIELNADCMDISNVLGDFKFMHSTMGSILKRYKSTFEPSGVASFHVNPLSTFPIKFDITITPDDVMGTWLASQRKEGVNPTGQPIAAYIMGKLIEPKIIDDMNRGSIVGVYDALAGTGGHPAIGVETMMDGLLVIVQNAVKNVTSPAFRIALDTLTDVNTFDEIKKFEKGIPAKIRKYVKAIKVSEQVMLWYKELFRLQYPYAWGNDKAMELTSPMFNIPIQVLTSLDDSQLVYATVQDNLVRLIDTKGVPQITSVQQFDRDIHITGDARVGYGFGINPLLFVSNYADATTGLGTDALNATYYPEITTLTTTAGGATTGAGASWHV